MGKPFVTKEQLISTLNQWGEGKISAQQLQDWMVTYYDPPEVEIGPGESEPVQEAMNIIMNEYELAKIPKFKTEGYALAIAFIESTPESFYQRRHNFIHNGFAD
ncbi:hypothetical protein [Psychromonas sp.]|uniref:hypothetical protein n=1 Tax=Psychromonas sp. TaxID=1884585 RepID=UPI0039E7065F